MEGFKTLVAWRQNRRIITILAALFVAQLFIGLIIIYLSSISVTKSLVDELAQIARSDISYNNGVWDTSKYDSDPEIPGVYRIYLITKDGFVIDRWRPIPGYLDTSDFKQLMTYQTLQSVHSVVNQDWKIYSDPIKDKKGGVVGVVTVGHFQDQADIDSTSGGVDDELSATAESIKSKIVVNGSNIDTTKINIHDVPFYISFQIVDQYNQLHLKSDNANSIDRLPSFIDPSYIRKQLTTPSEKIIRGNQGGNFWLKSVPIRDQSNNPVGVLIVARTISPFISLIERYLLIDSLAGLILTAGAAIVLLRQKNGEVQHVAVSQSQRLAIKAIASIKFNKEDCLICINDQQVPVTYSTNQYYMCLALFSAPKKKWETDELLDKFGDEDGSDGWRKTYDAMTSVNKKTSLVMEPKLIVTNNKTYQLNPALVDVINSKNTLKQTS